MFQHIFIFLIFLYGFVQRAIAGSVEHIYIRDRKPAIKGNDIQLVCGISQYSSSDTLNVYKSDRKLPQSLAGNTPLTICLPSLCLTTSIGRYRFSVDSSNVFINITNLNRSEDQNWWTCAIENKRKDLLLNITTPPSVLKYDNPPGQEQDLAENAVQLKCSTGCCYPQPAITWFYSEFDKNSSAAWSTSIYSSSSITGCSELERKYSSNLSLLRYATFPGNKNKTVQFRCSIQTFTGMSKPLYTKYSMDVRFAVRVSNASLKDGMKTVIGPLQLVIGVSKTLTCDTSISRPTAIIVWYIGVTEKQRSRSKSFTFSVENSYHNKEVYCKVFNIQQESQAVTSYKSTLLVREQVARKQKRLDNAVSIVGGSLSVVILGMFVVILFLIRKMRQKAANRPAETTATSSPVYDNLRTQHDATVTYTTLSESLVLPDLRYENIRGQISHGRSQIL